MSALLLISFPGFQSFPNFDHLSKISKISSPAASARGELTPQPMYEPENVALAAENVLVNMKLCALGDDREGCGTIIDERRSSKKVHVGHRLRARLEPEG